MKKILKITPHYDYLLIKAPNSTSVHNGFMNAFTNYEIKDLIGERQFDRVKSKCLSYMLFVSENELTNVNRQLKKIHIFCFV